MAMTKLDELEKLARNDLRLIESGTYSYANWKILAEGTLKLVAVVRLAHRIINDPLDGHMVSSESWEEWKRALKELKGE